ncbi:MAG: hypothetical protein KGI90_13360 [Burkholderiales bacterium]|nr:hypothetical protein [Burkholderiales bacterium]
MSEARTDGPRPAAATLLRVADALAWPLLVLRADAALLLANRAGRHALHEAQALHQGTDGRVLPVVAAARAAFLQALAEVAGSGTGRTLRLAHATGEAGAAAGASTASLAPLGPGGAGPVLLTLPAPGHQTEVDAFAERHGLTPAETRVLQRLLRGDNSTRAAAALGSSPATVRSQIVALRRKSGHRDLGTLLQAVARLPPLGTWPASSPGSSPAPAASEPRRGRPAPG